MKKVTRQDALKSIILPALAIAIGLSPDIAEAKSSKGQVKYQNHPNGAAKCASCRFFIPGKNATSMGSCQIVAGSISPNGWCTAYSKK